MAKNDVVLITGASGFIGGAIIHRLAGKYTLVGLDRAEAKDPPAPAQAIEIDLASDEAVHSALETVRAPVRRPHRLGHPSGCLLRHHGRAQSY